MGEGKSRQVSFRYSQCCLYTFNVGGGNSITQLKLGHCELKRIQAGTSWETPRWKMQRQRM